ncbi:MAG TPA: hypothetical protein VMJ70_15930 [Candidatus Sulfotelmatobacter sp.]|nr:hypothetical protein [Candidatus Sulfotelmatobacter sp.]
MNRRWLPLLFVLLLSLVSATHARATEIWTGRTFGFSKTPFGSPTQPLNQDRITPTVWISRANTQGIFNVALESAYTHNVSPKNTEWATGDAINHASLTFAPWEVWNGADPPSSVGVNACMHIIDADIYLDIVFTAWGGSSSGGAFSYLRALPPAVPTRQSSWGRIKRLYQ